ncbi:MAG: WbqC family protein [Leadbetterella sp.]|nr:WbqC family protein [Leadbetterella sp.]
MIFSPDFFPCIDFFRHLTAEDEVWINAGGQYRKQSYQTRAYVLGPHQVEMLRVPVKRFSNHELIRHIEIDYSTAWNVKAWRTLQNIYRNSPFFEYFEDYIYKVFAKRYERLIDLNIDTLTICLKLMRVDKTICPGDFSYYEYKNQFISFNAKKRGENAVNLPFPVYTQNFGNKFEPNLSILDLLFMKGTGSWEIWKSKGAHLRKKLLQNKTQRR